MKYGWLKVSQKNEGPIIAVNTRNTICWRETVWLRRREQSWWKLPADGEDEKAGQNKLSLSSPQNYGIFLDEFRAGRAGWLVFVGNH